MSDEVMEDKKEYELSYLAPTEEASIEVEKAIAAIGGEVATKGPLQNMRLAYPIKKHASAYFGFYYVKALPDAVVKLHDMLRVNKGILRHLIVTPPIKAVPRGERFVRDARKAPPSAGVPKIEEVKPAQPQILSNEGLEKELQQILQ